MRYPSWVLVLPVAVTAVYLNYWMWDVSAIVLGLPVNLLYHVVLSLALSPLMFAVISRAWPRYLDDED